MYSLMLFICTQCGRSDWVFGGDSPRCFYCGASLLKATECYVGCLMSSKFVLHRMTAVVEKHGFSEAADGRFKREREACSTALYALGLSEMFGPK